MKIFTVINKFFILVFVSLLFPVTLFGQMSGSLEWKQIPSRSMTHDGMARVLVTLAVPDIDKLLESSRATPPPMPGNDDSEKMKNKIMSADAFLSKAIESTASSILEGLPGSAYRVKHRFTTIPCLVMEISQEALAILQKHPSVLSVIPDLPSPLPAPVPDDAPGGCESKTEPGDICIDETGKTSVPTYDKPFLFDTAGLIGADQMWARGYTGQGWFVAVLDNGIRRTHEFFQGKTIIEACFSREGHCPNGLTSMYGTGAAAHYSSSYQGYDHGTHVAGIAAGKKPDGNLAGVAKDAGIAAVQVFSRFSAEECDDEQPCLMAWRSDILAGLEHIYSLRAEYAIGAVNLSLGEGQYSFPCDFDMRKLAIDNLKNANIPTIIAAGNNGWCGSLSAPSCISSAVAVSASDKSDSQALFTNWHQNMTNLFAPGVSIQSATGSSDSSYQKWNGTSMAAPHVAGGMTLMRQFRPTDTVDDLLARITEKGPDIEVICSAVDVTPRINLNNIILSSAIAYNIPSPAAADQPFVRIYNTSPISGAVWGTMYGEDGQVLGTAGTVLISNLEPGEVRVFDAGGISSALGISGWQGRAWMELEAEFEGLKVQGLVRGMALMNMSCVETEYAYNIPRPGGADQVFVRIYNTSDIGGAVRGTLYGQDGEILGSPNEIIVDHLAPREVVLLSAYDIASRFGVSTWSGRCWIRFESGPAGMRVMTLMRTPDGILSNMSCADGR